MEEVIKKNTKDQPGLKRTLGLFTGILMVAGCMIGTGVFKKIVPMAQSGLSETGIRPRRPRVSIYCDAPGEPFGLSEGSS